MEFNKFKGLFIDADKLDDDLDDELPEIDDKRENRYELAADKETKNKLFCQTYNSDIFTDGRDIDSYNKHDQPWYIQQQFLQRSLLLNKLIHPTIAKFIGLNLYNNECPFSDYEYDETSPTLFTEYFNFHLFLNDTRNLKMSPMHRQICIIGLVTAIHFLHHHNITIRYLNPDLIILDEKYYPKIFNIFVDYKQLDTPQLVPYLAPELLNDTYESYNPKSLDIYSLGRIIYLLLIGVEPFKHKNDKCRNFTHYNLMDKICNNIYFPYFPDKISMPFQELLNKCWSFNPFERPTIDQIYDIIVNEFPHNKYFFIDHLQMHDIHEISDYINMLKNFESQKDELSIFETFSIDIEIKDQSIQKMITSLNTFIDRNSVEGNESEFFTLIKEFSKIDDFYELGYLSKVMKFIFSFLEENRPEAFEFFDIVFNKNDLLKDAVDIKIGTISDSIISLNIPKSVTKICSRAFAGFNNLRSVFIPDSVEIIEDSAFIDCIKLSYVYLPDSIKGENLGKCAFKGCINLDNVKIPKDLTIIQEMTFYNNQNLKEIILNQNLKIIRENAFSYCSSLKTITIPDSVTHIRKNAFYPCNNLTTINSNSEEKYKIKLIKLGISY